MEDYLIPYRLYCENSLAYSLPYSLSNRPAPLTPKQLSKEARMALKRKRKQVKKSRKKNR